MLIILVIALVVFGPGKLPELGAGLGKSIREFKKALSDIEKQPMIENKINESKKAEEPVAENKSV